jgi:hypothetical protein
MVLFIWWVLSKRSPTGYNMRCKNRKIKYEEEEGCGWGKNKGYIQRLD